MSLLKLATKAVKLGTVASKHLGTANNLLAVAQTQADKHLAGTDLHKKLSTKIGVAKSHVNTAQNIATQLKQTPQLAAAAKAGGAKRKSRRKKSRKSRNRKRYSRKKTKKSRKISRSRKTRKRASRRRSLH